MLADSEGEGESGRVSFGGAVCVGVYSTLVGSSESQFFTEWLV